MSAPGYRFVWYELLTTDVSAATDFYRSVIGWQARDAGLPDRSYTILSAGETGAAGLMALPSGKAADDGRLGWTGYIGVDDADAFAERIIRAGGAVCKGPDDIPTVGRYAIVADPQGALFGLFQPPAAMQPPASAPGTPGHAGWRQLSATDWQAAFAFYAGLFGWTKDTAIDMGPMGTYQLFAAGGPAEGGMMTRLDPATPPFWLYFFNVATIGSAVARVTEGGGKIVHGPMQVPGGNWVAHCKDPQGAAFALVAPPGSSAPTAFAAE